MTQTTKQTPTGWKMQSLAEICDILIGGTPSRNKPEYWDQNKEGRNVWISIRDLSHGGKYISDSSEYISDHGAKASNVKLISKGNVLMSFKLTIGRVAITGREVYTNEAIAAFLIKNTALLDPNFLYYVLPILQYDTDTAIKGSTLNKEKLKTTRIVLPPLAEQTKIAAILSKVDEEIEKVERIIEQTEKLKKGLMRKLLTKGIEHTKFKQSNLGEIPEEWDVVILNDVANVIDSLHKTPAFSKDGYPMVRVTDIKPGFLNLDKTQKVTRNIFEEFTAKYKPQCEDIVISRVGSYGVVSYVDTNEPFCMGQNTVVLNPHINSSYLFYYLNSDQVKSQIENQVAGSGYKSLSLKSIRELNIAVPKEDEQKFIANILTSLDRKIANSIKVKSKFYKLKKGLMNDLLGGKVRVEI